MDFRRNEYIFYWFIENYSYCWHKNGKKLISPSFSTGKLENTTWNLELYPRGEELEDEGSISLFLCRDDQDDGPRKVTVDYELSVLKADGSAICFPEFSLKFERGDGNGEGEVLKTSEILLGRKSDYLPQDILSVCCKIYKGYGFACNVGQASARTRIRVETNSFLHVVENFSKLHPNTKHMKKIRSQSKRGRFITSCIYFNRQEIVMEIMLSDTDRILYKCEVSLLDTCRNVVECGAIDNKYDATRKNVYTLPLSLTRSEILNRKAEYLPDDKLSLICKCTFSSGIELQTIEETVDEIPLAVIQKQTSNIPRNVGNKAAEKPSTEPSLLEDNVPSKVIEKDPVKPSACLNIAEDLKALYIDQCLTDVEVRTKTKSFPAHKSILCARSPVLKAMMTNDMKEKITDCVQVDDLEDDIVQQLLIFLYSDNIEKLQWESTMHLYYAADKYQIGKLKTVCSSFLLENLTASNAGKLLILADTHSDNNLKKLVEDFILEHEEEIFVSKEWETLMETNPLLVMKTMQLKYTRKK